MLYLLHADEKSKVKGGNPGIRVVAYARNQSWFFPGATPEVAMILVRAALYEDALVHPRTEIAFGLKDGPKWTEQTVLKAAEK